MTPAEYAELFLQNEDLFATHAMNYVATLFAYIIAAHFVGARLTKVQVSIITLLYTMFQLGPANALMTSAQVRLSLGDKIRELSPEDFEILVPMSFLPGDTWFALFVSIGSWVVSLYYMWHVRKTANLS